MTQELREKAEPLAWRWAWKTTGSPLEQRFADPDLYMWTYRDSEPSGEAVKKMDVEPLYSEADYLSLLDDRDRLAAENDRLRKALEPFAASPLAGPEWDGVEDDTYEIGAGITLGDLRRAREALSSPIKEKSND